MGAHVRGLYQCQRAVPVSCVSLLSAFDDYDPNALGLRSPDITGAQRDVQECTGVFLFVYMCRLLVAGSLLSGLR